MILIPSLWVHSRPSSPEFNRGEQGQLRSKRLGHCAPAVVLLGWGETRGEASASWLGPGSAHHAPRQMNTWTERRWYAPGSFVGASHWALMVHRTRTGQWVTLTEHESYQAAYDHAYRLDARGSFAEGEAVDIRRVWP